MKAVQMTNIKELSLVDYPQPTLHKHEVLLKVMAVGVCGSDIPRINKYGPHVLPLIPGHEFAGEIVEIGEAVSNWHVGSRVCVVPLLPCYQCEWCKQGEYSLCEDYKYYGSRNDGAFAEYLAVDANNLIDLGPDIPFDWGATVDPAANAVHAFMRGCGSDKDTVCVFGLGPIGLFAIQYAKAMGVKKIFAVDIHDGKLEDAKNCGADFVVNSLKESPVEFVKKYTDGKGVSFSLDMSGSSIAQHQAILATGKLGRVVFLGISNTNLDLSKEAVNKILRGQLSVMGSWNSFSAPFPGKEWTESVRLMKEGRIDPSKIISDKYVLADIPEVFKRIDLDKSFIFNKIMFYPHGV